MRILFAILKFNGMKIGLVLSGGFVKGAYQIGVLKAISEFLSLDDIECVSSASIGVLNSYAYLTQQVELAENMWKSVCGDNARFLISQILRSNLINQKIISLNDNSIPITKRLYCPLLDLKHRDLIYKDLKTVDDEQLKDYLNASVSLPIYSKGVKIEDKTLYDGATVDNIPVFPLIDQPLDYIICVYFDNICFKFENAEFNDKIIKISFGGDSFLKQTFVVNQQSIEKMIVEGYEKANDILSRAFAKGIENKEFVYAFIKKENASKKSSIRVTADVIFTNVNKITQKVTKRKIV